MLSSIIDLKKSIILLIEPIKPHQVVWVHPTHWLNLALSHFLTCNRYSIDRRTDMDHLFNVHPGNGSVFLLKSLDREETAWHNISIIATELRKSERGLDFSSRWFDVLMQKINVWRQVECLVEHVQSLIMKENSIYRTVSRPDWLGNSQESQFSRHYKQIFFLFVDDILSKSIVLFQGCSITWAECKNSNSTETFISPPWFHLFSDGRARLWRCDQVKKV